MVEVQPEPPQGLGTGDLKPGAALEFSDHGGGAPPVNAVDHQIGVQRIITIQPGLQQPDKIVVSPGLKTTAIPTDATPNHVQR